MKIRRTANAGSSTDPVLWQTILPALPILFVLLLFTGYFVVLLTYGAALLRFPFDYDQGEGFELYDAVRLSHGLNIYLDNSTFPYYSSNYPPVYRLMLLPLVAVFGPRLWVGRAVTLVTTLVISGFIYLAVRRQFQSQSMIWFQKSVLSGSEIAISLLAALAFLAANYVYQIAPLARAHLPMVMFAVAGIFIIDSSLNPNSVKEQEPGARRPVPRWHSVLWLGTGVGFLILAGFTKLQAIDAIAAGFLYLLLRKPRWFLVALTISAAVSAVVVIALNILTNGQFWLNVVLANVNEYDIERTWFFYGQWFQLEGALIVCSVVYAVWDISRCIRERSLRALTIWTLYFIAGALMGMLTGKWGAGPTYFIAAIAASCVCTAGLILRVGRTVVVTKTSQRFVYPLIMILAAMVFGVQAALNVHLPTSGRLFGSIAQLIGVNGKSSYPPYPYYDSIGYTQLGHLLDPADIENGWELVRIAREAPGPIWSEEAMLTLNAGKDVITNPTQLYNLSKSSMLDTAGMLRMIQARAFGAVIFRAQFYPQDVLIAIGQNYHWVQAVRMNGFDYQVLYPNVGQ